MSSYPVLFAVYPLLFLYAQNIHHLLLRELFIPLSITGIITLFLYLLFCRIIGNRKKAALLISLLAFMFFTYGHVFHYLNTLRPAISHHLLYPLWSLLLLLGSATIIRLKRDLQQLDTFLQLLAVVLILITLVTIGSYRRSMAPYLQKMEGLDGTTIPLEEEGQPDIYYLIFDSYAHHRILEEVYDDDNLELRCFLEEKGFYIVEEAYSNYALTFLSLASSLNMEYIPSLIPEIDQLHQNQLLPYHLIENNRVMELLSGAGYQIVFFHSGWSGTIESKNADYHFQDSYWGNEFYLQAAGTTMLQPFLTGNAARNRVLYTFERLGGLDQYTQGPRFVFAHILPPHPPYLFDGEGGPVENSPLFIQDSIWSYRGQYLEQLLYVNTRIEELVGRLLTKEEKPIIILQGDHGPASYDQWQHPEEEFIEERMGIFHAIYLPEKEGADLLYPSITPVNTFRLLFNHYFQTGYPLLDDRIYFSNYQKPYQFQEVTPICRP